MTPRRCRGDAGQVGGIEAVPFGLLVLVVGVAVLAHTWAVVDAKFATAGAARAATRAYVEASTPAQGRADARRAAADAADALGRSLDGVDLDAGLGAFGRCVPARFVARSTVPAFGLPWRPDRPTVTVRSAHQELVDPYRDGLPGLADCEAP
jgi:hypothetical protein